MIEDLRIIVDYWCDGDEKVRIEKLQAYDGHEWYDVPKYKLMQCGALEKVEDE